jgi:S-adenosylmethionine synthetase
MDDRTRISINPDGPYAGGPMNHSGAAIAALLQAHFDFRPAAILQKFRLRHLVAGAPNGFYQHLAGCGHFGRDDLALPWEMTDKAGMLRSAAG